MSDHLSPGDDLMDWYADLGVDSVVRLVQENDRVLTEMRQAVADLAQVLSLVCETQARMIGYTGRLNQITHEMDPTKKERQ